jgi:hypothetical protein
MAASLWRISRDFLPSTYCPVDALAAAALRKSSAGSSIALFTLFDGTLVHGQIGPEQLLEHPWVHAFLDAGYRFQNQ